MKKINNLVAMKATKEQKLIYRMLTENTGSHFLDSGGAYGRNWERNQKKTITDFMREPEELITFNLNWKELQRTVSVFHYLSGLELDDICDKFNRRNTNPKDWEGGDKNCYGVSKRAWNWLTENHEVEVKYAYNTYNGDSDLSQVLQYSEVEIDGEEYFIMQIHNGCDVRGGYTDAKLFKANYWSYHIHEYLQEYKCGSELIEDINEGYLTDIQDYYDSSKTYTAEFVSKVLSGEGTIDDVYQQFIDNIDKFDLEFGYDGIVVNEAKERAQVVGGEWWEYVSDDFKIGKLESIGFVKLENV